MKPVYFPFTYISESEAGSMHRILGQPVVFQPVSTGQPEAIRRLAESGVIEIRVPCSGDDDRLMRFARDFEAWGRVHHGNDMSLKETFKDGFYNTTFVSQIRTDILKNRKESAFEPDPVFLSRLFLLMAQEFDVSQSEIEAELASTSDLERDLFAGMTGEKPLPGPAKQKAHTQDAGEYMTDSRLAAWFRLMQNSDRESAFLVTDSPAVMEQMADHLPGLEKVFSIDAISCTRTDAEVQKLMQFLTRLAAIPWSGADHVAPPDFISGDSPGISFKLYILPNAGPMDISRIFAEGDESVKANEKKWLNTLVGVFQG